MIEIGACSSSVPKTASLRSFIAGPKVSFTIHVNTSSTALPHYHTMVGFKAIASLSTTTDYEESVSSPVSS